MRILNILSSINAQKSNSNKLVQAINEHLLSTYGENVITVRDLTQNGLPHFNSGHFGAFMLEPEMRTDADKTAISHSDEAIAEIQQADAIVIAVPFYNFSIPDTLKSWIDHIVRAGVTFTYGENGPKGLLSGKKVYLAIASGGIYSNEPMNHMDFAEPYLRQILGFIGLTDVTTFRMEGTKIPGVIENAYDKAVGTISGHVL